jgi:transposase
MGKKDDLGSLRSSPTDAPPVETGPSRAKPNYNFRPYDQKQHLLIPPSLDDWLPPDHLARYISDIVELMDRRGDLDRFYEPYRENGQGAWAYDPKMMVKAIMYGFSIGIDTTRKIAKAMETDIAFRFITGNQFPDFRTIGHFIRTHEDALEGLFPAVLQMCQEAGLVEAGRVVLDSRVVQGNASLEKNRTRGGIVRQVRDILEEARRREAEEDAQFGDRRGDELPENLKEPAERLRIFEEARRKVMEEIEAEKEREQIETERDQTVLDHDDVKEKQGKRESKKKDRKKPRTIREKLQRLIEADHQLDEKDRKLMDEQQDHIDRRKEEEAATGKRKRGRKPLSPEEKLKRERSKRKKEPQANITDPESRMLKTRFGWKQGFRDQTMVDPVSQVILGYDVVPDENDKRQLDPMLERYKDLHGEYPDDVITDSGYFSDEAARVAETKTELWSTTQKDWKTRKAIREQGYPRGRIPKGLSRTERMERKLMTKKGREMYDLRPIVECAQGQMSNRGFTRYRRRGTKKARIESSLWKTTHNILKIFKFGWKPC